MPFNFVPPPHPLLNKPPALPLPRRRQALTTHCWILVSLHWQSGAAQQFPSIPYCIPEPLPTHEYFQKPGQLGLIIQRQGRREEEEEKETAAKKSWRQSGGGGEGEHWADRGKGAEEILGVRITGKGSDVTRGQSGQPREGWTVEEFGQGKGLEVRVGSLSRNVLSQHQEEKSKSIGRNFRGQQTVVLPAPGNPFRAPPPP